MGGDHGREQSPGKRVAPPAHRGLKHERHQVGSGRDDRYEQDEWPSSEGQQHGGKNDPPDEVRNVPAQSCHVSTHSMRPRRKRRVSEFGREVEKSCLV